MADVEFGLPGTIDFTGEHRHTVDPKGRLILPAEYRERLARGGFLTKFSGGCLAVFTSEEYELVVSRLREQVRSGTISVNTTRAIAAATKAVKPDNNGRIPVPEALRDWAGIDAEVVIAGLYNHLELWSPTRWDALQSDGDPVASGEEALARAAF